MITERDWDQLQSDWHSHGATVRRVYPRSAHDIFIVVRDPDGTRMLTVRVRTQAADEVLRRVHELPRTRGLEMQFARLGNGNGELRVVLTDSSLREVFNPLASDNPAARDLLDSLLVRVGYLSDQRDLYDEPRYTVRKQRFWHVTADFPRITEADLRPGVGDCEYRISVVGLEQYILPAEDVLSAVKEAARHE